MRKLTWIGEDDFGFAQTCLLGVMVYNGNVLVKRKLYSANGIPYAESGHIKATVIATVFLFS
ncbi:MAG: hypothetical protein Q8L52_03140 [bacterium]|nr:hypothetical protein [bacterium]